jgi:hypothetical protein
MVEERARFFQGFSLTDKGSDDGRCLAIHRDLRQQLVLSRTEFGVDGIFLRHSASLSDKL